MIWYSKKLLVNKNPRIIKITTKNNISNLFLVSNNLNSITKKQFISLRVNLKEEALPYLTQTLRDYISLRPIKSSTQKQHYQRS